METGFNFKLPIGLTLLQDFRRPLFYYKMQKLVERSIFMYVRCNSQKYIYPRNYTPGIFSRTKISQKHTGGMRQQYVIGNTYDMP